MTDSEVDRAFEARLERLFADAPSFADADLFAVRVRDRLNRRWNMRGTVIGALGLLGGMFVVYQAAAAGLIGRAQSLPGASRAAMGRALEHLLPWRLSVSGGPFAGEMIVVAIALAVLALGLAIVRAIREI
jgi:hypothetical protein